MFLTLALLLAQPADRVAELEAAGMKAVTEINDLAARIEYRSDFDRSIDSELIGKLSETADALYEVVSEGQFVCDDHPERCDDDTIPVSRAEYEAITLRICGPNGSVSRDENGPVCDRKGWDGRRYRKQRH